MYALMIEEPFTEELTKVCDRLRIELVDKYGTPNSALGVFRDGQRAIEPMPKNFETFQLLVEGNLSRTMAYRWNTTRSRVDLIASPFGDKGICMLSYYPSDTVMRRLDAIEKERLRKAL